MRAAIASSWVLVATLTSVAPASAHDSSPTVGLPTPPASYVATAQHRIDIDADGVPDTLSVLELDGPDAGWAPRALWIVSGRDGRATLAPRALLCRQCGGMFGDPLQPIEPTPRGFVLRFEGGSRELWSSQFTFDHDPATRTWHLVERSGGMADRLTNETRQAHHTLPPPAQTDLVAFNPADEGDAGAPTDETSDLPPDAMSQPPLGATLRPSYTLCQHAAGGVTPDMQACIETEATYQQARMTDALHALAQRLDKARRTALDAEQAAWAHRDPIECPWHRDTSGQAQRLAANECSMERVSIRADVLETRLRAPL